jgi:ABC-type transport system substrate-binding protein
MKKLYSLLFFIILFGCTTEKDADKVVVSWGKGVTTLDPACADGFESAEVVFQIYEPLITYDTEKNEIKPLLAESWDKGNGLVWEFKLKKGVKFHDGTPFDSKAVVFSFKRQMEGSKNPKAKKSGCGYTYWNAYFDVIKSVKAVDKYTVRFVLFKKHAPFIKTLEIFAVSIVPEFDYINEPDYLDKHPNGTGPFKFKKRSEKTIVLEKNENYHDKSKTPGFKKLIFQTTMDSRQRLLALEGGDVDLAYYLDPNLFLTIQLHPFLKLQKIESTNIVYLALNTSKYPFSRKQNRLAVNYALDRDKIVKLVYQGLGDVAQSCIPGNLKINKLPILDPKKDKWYPHNPDKALELFYEGGMYLEKDKRPIDLYVFRSPRTVNPNPILMANLIKNDLEKLGIKVKIHALPYKEYKRAVNENKHDLAIHGWISELTDPDNIMYGLLHGSSLGKNYSKFSNREYNRSVSLCRSIIDPAKRIKEYKKALAIFKREAPWVPIAYSITVKTLSRRISGLKHNNATLSRYNLLKVKH